VIQPYKTTGINHQSRGFLMPKIGISDAKYSKLALKHLAASNGIVLTQLLSDFVKHFDIEIQDIQTYDRHLVK
jgi:hypothetical protein